MTRRLAAALVILALGAAALVLAGRDPAEPDPSPPQQTPSPAEPRPSPADTGSTRPAFEAGLVTGDDPDKDARAAARLGARLVRAELPISASVDDLRPAIAANAENGTRVLPLAGFAGRLPTPAEAAGLARWAREFGPGGTFWRDRDDGHLAVREIEFGNETSFTYQYGDDFGDASYAQRAMDYARRLRDAQEAIARTGVDVGLLAQADTAGSGSSRWVDSMFDAVPDLASRVAGWTVHPYGPPASWRTRLDEVVAHTASRAPDARLPIWITEWGLASDDGRCLDDNYGWDPCMTLDAAADALRASVREMRSRYGSRLRALIVYQSHDQAPPGASDSREHYFGALRMDLGEKGAYSAAVRALLNGGG